MSKSEIVHYSYFFHMFLIGIQASELEPLVGRGTDAIDGMVPEGDEREEDMTDLKISFRSDCKPELLIRFLA